jgi:hypothetical protein
MPLRYLPCMPRAMPASGEIVATTNQEPEHWDAASPPANRRPTHGVHDGNAECLFADPVESSASAKTAMSATTVGTKGRKSHAQRAASRLLVAGFLLVSLVPSLTAAPARNPDYDITPLSVDDVELYVAVLRTTVERLENPTAEMVPTISARRQYMKEKDWREKCSKGGRTLPPLDQQFCQLANETQKFAYLDETIAMERGVFAHYMAVRDALASRLGIPASPTMDHSAVILRCGRGGDCGPNPSQGQIALMARERAAREADSRLLASHREEIMTLLTRLTDDLASEGVFSVCCPDVFLRSWDPGKFVCGGRICSH